MNDENNIEILPLIEELHPVVDGQSVRRSGGETWSLAFAPDNSHFAWSCGHRTITILPWHGYGNRPYKGGFCDQNINPISHDQSFPIVINCGDIVWSMAFGVLKNDNRLFNSLFFRRHHFNYVLPSGDTMVLAVGLNNGRIKIFTTTGKKLLTELVDHKDVVRDLKFSPDGSLVLSASRDSTLKLWDLKDDGNMLKTLKHSDNEWIMCCAWSPDTKWAAGGGTGKEVYIWDTKSWILHRKLTGHLHTVATCQFSPDGAILATGSYDTAVILWDHVKGQTLTVLRHMLPAPRPIFASGDNDHFVRHLSFSSDGEHLASICDDGNVRIWNIYQSWMPECVTQVENALCSAYSSDGYCLAVGTRDGSAHLFATPMLVRSLARICRSVIRLHVALNEIDLLPIPGTLKLFLLYKDVGTSSKLCYYGEN